MQASFAASTLFTRRRCGVYAFAVVMLLAITSVASAQTPVAPIDAATTDPGWLKVETLELGKRLRVNTREHTHIDCLFGKADAESLTCGGVVFQKADIKSVKPSHRARSTFVGLGVGYGAAAGLSAAVYANHGNHCTSSACIITIAVVDLGLIIAMPIVFHIYDVTSTSIYKAP